MEHDFKIMDHEIEHDADIGAAPWIWRKAMGFDKLGAGEFFFERPERWIEAFDVTDLQDGRIAFRHFHQFTGLSGVVRNWLFDERVFASTEKEHPDFMMTHRGSGNADGINFGRHRLKIRERLDVVLLRNALGHGRVAIIDADKSGIGQFSANARMFATDVADADNADI